MKRTVGDPTGDPTSGTTGRPAGPAGVPPRADVALMAGYHSPQLEVAVRLNTNEAPEPPPAELLERSAEIWRTLRLNRYPDRSAGELRARLAVAHGVDPAQVFCANGSNEVLQCLLLAYGGAGRSVAVFEPTYALHRHIAEVTGTHVRTGERDEDWWIPLGEWERVVAEGRAAGPNDPIVTFVCSPNNPTGRLEPTDRLEAILETAPGLVVVDEAYGQFAPRSAIELLGRHPRLVVVRTFSKTWSLAGLRLGYALADPEVVRALDTVVLPYHLDAAKQAIGSLALEYEAEMSDRVGRLVAERGRVVAGLEALGAKVIPSDANFVLFSMVARDTPAGEGRAGEGRAGEGRALWEHLVAASVLVRDVSSWPRLAGYLRVTVGTPAEDDAFLAALASWRAPVARRG
jgi:histidinol-phosphate aminotransferase